MRKNQCINCGQLLKAAKPTDEFCWIGKTDGEGYCREGATLCADGVWRSEQEHTTESEMA